LSPFDGLRVTRAGVALLQGSQVGVAAADYDADAFAGGRAVGGAEDRG
jgi:hypothetical protein